MKIGVIANCQAQAISDALRMLPSVDEVKVLPVHLFFSSLIKDKIEEFEKVVNDKDAIILTFILNERFGDFETARLIKRAKANVFTITNLYFTGLHPDITYAGSMKARIQSPMGDYHSKIIIKSYFNGLGIGECKKKFCRENYIFMGYHDEFERSSLELIERDKKVDIKFAKEFIDLCVQGPNLYTFNHPSPKVFFNYLKKIASHLGLDFYDIPLEYFDNHLIKSGWWPYYPELLNDLEVCSSTKYDASPGYLWRQPKGKGGKVLDLSSFIHLSYAKYDVVKDDPESVTSYADPALLG